MKSSNVNEGHLPFADIWLCTQPAEGETLRFTSGTLTTDGCAFLPQVVGLHTVRERSAPSPGFAPTAVPGSERCAGRGYLAGRRERTFWAQTLPPAVNREPQIPPPPCPTMRKCEKKGLIPLLPARKGNLLPRLSQRATEKRHTPTAPYCQGSRPGRKLARPFLRRPGNTGLPPRMSRPLP